MAEIGYSDEEGSFRIDLPPDWSASRDEEDGGLLALKGGEEALLHLIPFARDGEDEADPAEELYAFLAEQEIELEEDEVEDVELPGGGSLAVCEYLADDEEGEMYFLAGVATAPGQLVFASFSCPPEHGERWGDEVRSILKTLTL